MIPTGLTYGSVCSGVEAASLAWEPLGLSPLWFAEIEEFPSMVLAERWPHVPNLGDMTTIADRIRAGEIPAPDVLVGGTPCQDFSLAGLRKGMKGKRGQLTLAFVELANVIDEKRAEDGKEPVIIVWENVPGVYSDNSNAFGNFLAALAGEFEAFEPGSRPADGRSSDYWSWSKTTSKHFAKWSKHGCVIGRIRNLGWTTKDAQYFGVAQRRRRCFLVASARTDFDPTSVFLESGSVCRDIAPSRETGSQIATNTGTGSKNGSHWDSVELPHPTLSQSHNCGGIGSSNQEVFAQRGAGIVPHFIMAHGQAGAEINIDLSPTLTCNHEQPILIGEQPVRTFRMEALGQYSECDFASTIKARDFKEATDLVLSFPAQMTSTQYASADPDVSQTIQALNPTAVCYSLDDHAISMVVRRITPVEAERLQGMPDNHTLIPVHKTKRLTDDEVAYLRHHYPDITDDMIFKMAKDGPRHKAIGNSMAVPVMRWVMEQILHQLSIVTTVEETVKDVKQKAQKVKRTAKNVKPETAYCRPFLKWAGGKYSVLDDLFHHMPDGLRLVEPFVGAGSVFLNADRAKKFNFSCALLADVNADLINLYQTLACAPMAVITKAREYFDTLNSADGYDAIKDAFNDYSLNAIDRAAAFIFINRHCFNGLTRYNQKGIFNVGYGGYDAPYFPEHEMLQFVAVASSSVFLNAGFRKTISLCGEGDVIYCDPPYEPMPGKGGFVTYASGGFHWKDQTDLAAELVKANKRGAKVLITNSGAPAIRKLYEASGFTLHQLNARRSISSKGSTRETAKDVLGVLL